MSRIASRVKAGATAALDRFRRRRNVSPNPFTALEAKSVSVYHCPEKTWDRFLCDIAGAEKRVLLENYMFEDGKATNAVCDAVHSATSRGAEVKVLTDWVGSDLTEKGRAQLERAGAKFRVFNPPNYQWVDTALQKAEFLVRRLGNKESLQNKLVQTIRRSARNRMGHSMFHRTHRRITVVDEDVGWVGGMAVADAWWHEDPQCSKALIHGSYKARDTMLRVEDNPVVAAQLTQCFNQLWDYQPGQQPSPQLPPVLTPQAAQLNEIRVIPHSAQQRLFGKTLYSQLQAAKQSAWLCTPYYIPTAKLHRALRRAAERGVDVRLVLPGYVTDHPMVRFAGWHYYDKLLKSGVKVYEYQPAFMHAKAAVFDDEWVLLGSANLDRFSILTNHELAVEARMPSLNEQLTQQFEVDFSHSHEIKQEEWDQRCLSNRVLEKMCSPFQFAM